MYSLFIDFFEIETYYRSNISGDWKKIIYAYRAGLLKVPLTLGITRETLTDYKILSRTATIVNVLGMHARPAAMIAKLAQDAVAVIWIGAGDNRADASSIIDILSLGCSRGYEVTLEAENEDDLPILDSIKEIIDKGFGEDLDG